MELVIEQLGTTNNVLERQKFDQHQVWLGRGYDNDVILTDEHVDAAHARLVFDGEGDLWIEDRDSVNGIRRPRHRAHLDREKVASGDVFLIGRSRVRILLGEHPVPPAVRIRWSEVLLLWLGKPAVLVALALAYAITKIAVSAMTTIGEFRWSQLVQQNLWEIIGFTALAVAIYFLSVLFRRGGNFVAHLSLLILLFFVAGLLDLGLQVAVYNASDSVYPLLEGVAEARGYLVLFLYIWSILYLAFHLSLWRRTAIAVAAVAASFTVEHLPDDSNFAFLENETLPMQPTFLPPALLVRGAEPADRVDADQQAVFGAADRAREELLDELAEAEASFGAAAVDATPADRPGDGGKGPPGPAAPPTGEPPSGVDGAPPPGIE